MVVLRKATAALALIVLASATVLSFSVSCAAPDKDRVTEVINPDYAIYKDNVDAYLARRCGTLDCHGQAGRGYRIYSREGFRDYTLADGSLVSGQQPTETARHHARRCVGVEPEQMNRVMASQGSDEELKKWVFLRKAQQIERHKGGPAMAPDDPGYRCVRAWLQVPVVKPDQDGFPIPIPPNERVFAQRDKDFCALAASYP